MARAGSMVRLWACWLLIKNIAADTLVEVDIMKKAGLSIIIGLLAASQNSFFSCTGLFRSDNRNRIFSLSAKCTVVIEWSPDSQITNHLSTLSELLLLLSSLSTIHLVPAYRNSWMEKSKYCHCSWDRVKGYIRSKHFHSFIQNQSRL